MRLGLALCALICSTQITIDVHATTPKKVEGTWLSLMGHWGPDPPEAPNPGRWIAASFLHFCSDGRFLMYDVTLREIQGRRYIGPSDGFTQYKGRWTLTNATLDIKYTFMDSMYVIYPLGTQPDKSDKSASVIVRKDALRLRDRTYKRIKPENARNVYGLPKCEQ